MTCPRPPIAPVLVPHGTCPPSCPLCPGRGVEPQGVWPGRDQVRRAVERARARHPGRAVELSFYGGDFSTLPRHVQSELLAAAESEMLRGAASSVRLTLEPTSVLRAPLRELHARGVDAVELPIRSLDPGVRRRLGERVGPRGALAALARLRRARLRSIAHLMPGLPGSTHRTAVAGAEFLARAHPSAVRVLPALALDGTRLAERYRSGAWEPMSLAEALATCRHVVQRIRSRDIPVIRVGLQPGRDLQEAPEVLAGPHHPSLGLLVDAELLKEEAVRALTSAFAFGTRAYTFVVHPRDESRLRGQENRTMNQLRAQFRLRELRVVAREDQPSGRLRVLPGALDAHRIPPPRSERKAS